jgi:hypothetical protein
MLLIRNILVRISTIHPDNTRNSDAALPRTLIEARRAIIFTNAEIIYRPPLGPPRRVPIAMVQHLTKSRVATSYLLRASGRPGIIITLANGAKEAWPLDFDGRDEILQRLGALTGKAIDGSDRR